MRIVIRWLASLALLFPLAACAQSTDSADYRAGVHFEKLDQPLRVTSGDKIEVAEIFWYGCSHCYTFEPVLHQWEETLGEDVVLVRSPAIWNPLMEVHARAYFVADALDVEPQVSKAMFHALNVEGKRLPDADSLVPLFAEAGIDEETFRKTYNSFGIDSQVKTAFARQQHYRVKGTPEVVVQGQYHITARMAGGQKNMLTVADYLIEQIRAGNAP